MAPRVHSIIVDCRDASSQARWWATVLGYHATERNTGEFAVTDPSRVGTPLYFMNVPEPKTGKNRLHIDITTPDSVKNEVARLVALGGTLVEMRRDPPEYANPDLWAVMQDPEGNEFCLLNDDSITGFDAT